MELKQTLEAIEVSKLKPAPGNPRKTVNVGELAESVAAVGVVEPLVVMRSDDPATFLVVCGARRLAAAKKAGLTLVPALVREDLDEKAARLVMLVENLAREDLTPLEEARTFKALIDDYGHTQRDLAAAVGRSQSHVSKRLTLLDLPKSVQTKVDKDEMPVVAALEFARLGDDKAMVEAAVEQAERQSWASPQRIVDRVLEEKERLAKIGQAKAELDAKGIAVVPYEDWGHGTGKYERVGPDSYGDLRDVKVADHKKADCHAVGIDRDAKVVELCSKASNHRTRKASASAGDKKRRVHDAEMKAAKRERVEYLTKLVQGRVGASERMEGIVLGFLRGANAYPSKVACLLLGLDPEQDGEGPVKTLRKEASKGQLHAARVGLALGIGYLEESSYGTYATNETTAEYIAWLKKVGYDVSSAELLEAAGKAPR